MTEVMAFMNVVQALEQFDNIDDIGMATQIVVVVTIEYKLFLYIDKGLQIPKLLETPYS